jgi:hypothetical protein
MYGAALLRDTNISRLLGPAKPMLDPIDVGTRADLQQKNLYDSHSTAKRSRKARFKPDDP